MPLHDEIARPCVRISHTSALRNAKTDFFFEARLWGRAMTYMRRNKQCNWILTPVWQI